MVADAAFFIEESKMAGTKAQGSKLFYSDDAGVSWDQVTGVTAVAKPTGTAADIDVTDLSSTAMEYEKDIPDNGTVSHSFNFNGADSVHQALVVLEKSKAQGLFKTEYPEPGVSTVTTFQYNAFVDTIDVNASRGGKQEGTLNLRIDGAVTTAHGATAES